MDKKNEKGNRRERCIAQLKNLEREIEHCRSRRVTIAVGSWEENDRNIENHRLAIAVSHPDHYWDMEAPLWLAGPSQTAPQISWCTNDFRRGHLFCQQQPPISLIFCSRWWCQERSPVQVVLERVPDLLRKADTRRIWREEDCRSFRQRRLGICVVMAAGKEREDTEKKEL